MAARTTRKKPETNQRISIANLSRSFLIALCAILGVLAITAYTTVRWTETQVLNTEAWTATLAPLPQNQDFVDGLSTFIVAKVYDQQAVEAKVKDALPPKADFLSPTLAAALKNVLQTTTQRLIGSDTFATIWTAAIRSSHQRLVDTARSEPTEIDTTRTISLGSKTVSVDLSAVREKLGESLGRSDQALSPDDGKSGLSISANLQTKMENLRKYIRTIDFAYVVLPTLALASVLSALALTHNRRRTLMVISICVLGLALLQLIGVKALRPSVLNQVQNASFRPAVAQVYDTMVGSFNSIVRNVGLVALIVWLLTLAAGSNKLFSWIRKYIKTSNFKKNDYYSYWQEFRLVFAAYRPYIWGGMVAITLFLLAFVLDVNWRTVTNAVLLLISGIALVQIIGSPPYYIRAKR